MIPDHMMRERARAASTRGDTGLSSAAWIELDVYDINVATSTDSDEVIDDSAKHGIQEESDQNEGDIST